MPLGDYVAGIHMQNLARTLLQAFRAYGAREIFGIPGDFALPF
jgi:TPP-dependent 2-oxoacid decarboxylase